MDLYPEEIPSLLASTDIYLSMKNHLFEFIANNQNRHTDSVSNLSIILQEDEAQNICSSLAYTAEIMQRYESCTGKMKTMIKEIDNRYDIND
jgi:hypothetical protein